LLKRLSVGNLRIYISLKKDKTKSKFTANIGFAFDNNFIRATVPRNKIKLLPVFQKIKFSPFLGLYIVADHIPNARTL